MATTTTTPTDTFKLTPATISILVIGEGNWGRGDDFAEAYGNARKPKQYAVFVCHPETQVDEHGQMSWPIGYQPKEIMRKVAKK